MTSSTYIGPKLGEVPKIAPKFRRNSTKELPSHCLPIIALDPGGTTGWSLLVLRKELQDKDIFSWNLDTILRSKLKWEHGEIVTHGCEDEAIWNLFKLIDDWPSAAIVVEDFILQSQRKEKSRELLSPVRLTAKLETYLWRQGRRMFLQQASQAKTTVTNERMGLMGCYTPTGSLEHARDADRHAILFVRRCIGATGTPIKQGAWPHLYYPNGE